MISNWPKGTVCGPLNQTLIVNQACLDVVSDFDVPLKFYTRNTECFECDYTIQKIAKPHAITSYIIDTSYEIEAYFAHKNDSFCKIKNHFEDFGHYQLNISRHNCSNIAVLKEPEKFLINIGLLFSFFFCIFLLWSLLKLIYRKCLLYLASSGAIATYSVLRFIFRRYQVYISTSNISLRELEVALGEDNNLEDRKIRSRLQQRITSIDAFRGLAILLMIFVNYGGGEYTYFRHAPWNGLTIADLVFPWFVWIMGASIVLSLRSNLRTSTPKKRIFSHIIRRTVLLIAFGIILNSGKREKGFLRICGVLQRLGVTYFVVAFIELLVAKPQKNEFGPWYCQDIVDSWIEWLLTICFIVAHELLTFLVPVPGCPTGYLGAGGFSEHSSHRNCTGGAAGYIDRLIITSDHMYHRGTFVKLYKPPVPYDPEGLLGTLTSIVCAFLGVHAARIIITYQNPYTRIQRWILWALITGVSAGLLCNWSQNDGIIPVNKNLWSLSYVLASSSLAFFILAVFYSLINFTHVWKGFPFIYPGMNAIALYLGHSLLKEQLPWRWVPCTNTHIELLIMDISATIIWLLISFMLYKYKIFISL